MRIEERLHAPGIVSETAAEAWFWDSDLGREIASEADAYITREEVLDITAKIIMARLLKGSVWSEKSDRDGCLFL